MMALEAEARRTSLTEIAPAAFPFLDVKTGQRWRLRPNGGFVPFWIWSFKRRVPGSAVGDYMGAVRLARAGDGVVNFAAYRAACHVLLDDPAAVHDVDRPEDLPEGRP